MTSRSRRATRPRLESLDRRDVPAVSVYENAGQLWIIGDNRANNVQVYDVDGVANPSEASYIEVYADGQSYATSTTITNVNIDLGKGNDSLRYDLGDPSLIQTYLPQRLLNVSLGAGNDQVYTRINGFQFEADPQAQALGPGSWALQYDLGAGHDVWAMDLDADVLGLLTDSGTTASSLSVYVQGAGGNDRIDFNAVRDLRVELASLSVVLRGGAGNDTLNARSTGQLLVEESTVAFERYGDAGNDRIYGTQDITALGDAVVDQVIDTGTGNDLVNTFFRSRSRRRST